MSPDEHGEPGGSQRLSDIDAYRLLVRRGRTMHNLSARCWSTAAATALTAAGQVLRQLAAALYRANIKERITHDEDGYQCARGAQHRDDA